MISSAISSATSLGLVGFGLLIAGGLHSAQGGSRFGYAVSSGDVNGDGYGDVIVGEPFHDGPRINAGRVAVYHGSQTGLAANPTWKRAGFQQGAQLGKAVVALDVNGDAFDDLVVGAPGVDRAGWSPSMPVPAHRANPAAGDAGAIAVFLGSSGGLSSAPVLLHVGLENGDLFGRSVASAGDVNGDGFDDLLVGAPGFAGGHGAAFVFLGSASGPGGGPEWSAVGEIPGVSFGFAVAGVGDMNGDGFDDFVVGAPRWPFLEYGAGRIALYHGSSSGPESVPAWIDGPAIGSDDHAYGTSVAWAGDLDGQGFGSLIVGGPGASNGGHGIPFAEECGFVKLFSGGLQGPQLEQTDFRLTDLGHYGQAVAFAGDTNGDGIPETLVGEPGGVSGAFSVLHLEASGSFFLISRITRSGTQASAHLGFAVSSAGDVDDDGYDDVVVGEPYWDGSVDDEGRVHVYRGSSTSIGTSPAWTLVSP